MQSRGIVHQDIGFRQQDGQRIFSALASGDEECQEEELQDMAKCLFHRSTTLKSLTVPVSEEKTTPTLKSFRPSAS